MSKKNILLILIFACIMFVNIDSKAYDEDAECCCNGTTKTGQACSNKNCTSGKCTKNYCCKGTNGKYSNV